MWKFDQQPGNYFVVATLLPLVAFVLILLAFLLWSVFRRYRQQPGAALVYQILGGDTPGLIPAFLATGAIALAFVFSLTGFAIYVSSHTRQEASIEKARTAISHTLEELSPVGKEPKKRTELERKLNKQRETLDLLVSRWNGQVTWLQLASAGQNDPRHGILLTLGFHVDGLTAILFLMVTGIATLVHVYSIGYLRQELQETVEDPEVASTTGILERRGRFGRFFLYLPLFCFAMLNLVLADNLFQVFVSWELVGICSYLLIGFYYERRTAAAAATKAFLTNQIGDAGFLVGMLIVWTYIGSFQFDDIFARLRSPEQDTHGELTLAGRMLRRDLSPGDQPGKAAQLTFTPLKDRNHTDISELDQPRGSYVVLFPRVLDASFHGVAPGQKVPRCYASPAANQYGYMPYWALVAAGLGIFLGCVGKSAQFPLHVWLPDAMQGPTPVSALIHAATMVAAGVYLVGRCYPLFTPDVLLVIAYVGAISLFLGGTIAMVVTDLKQVLAYSTISQLGYMMLAMGIGGWVAGLFHLLTHAIFKSLLFLGAGSVIHGCGGEQDMTKLGGLYPRMRVTALTMLAGSLALAGVPLFIGWYSKDSVMAHALGYVWVYPQHLLLFVLPIVTAGFTAFYILRLWLLTFTGEARDRQIHDQAHEAPPWMTVPLIILAVLSIVAAWGWPIWDTQASPMESFLRDAQPAAVRYDFGHVLEHGEVLSAGSPTALAANIRYLAYQNHHLAGYLALLLVALGMLFALLLYTTATFDPAEASEQFPAVNAFLVNRWYLDEIYRAVVVQPALRVASWINAFDRVVLDGVIHGVALVTVRLARWNGLFDKGIVDGLVNRVASMFYNIGGKLRSVQTGSLRAYVLFLVLAAVGFFFVLSYFVTLASAG